VENPGALLLRLMFTVVYEVENDGFYEEKIVSSSFQVSSNGRRSKGAIEGSSESPDPKAPKPLSQFKGVTWAGNWGSVRRPWRVRLWQNGKQVFSSYFEKEDEAKNARDLKAKELGIVIKDQEK